MTLFKLIPFVLMTSSVAATKASPSAKSLTFGVVPQQAAPIIDTDFKISQ